MVDKKIGVMVSILGIISIVLIATGITYAFFNYTQEGTIENVVSTGAITFIYEEVDKQGAGIKIENAYPMSDGNGKIQSDSKEVFNFTVKSTTGNSFEIPYTITARKKADSTLDEDAVKLYLTEVSGETEIPLAESIYEDLQNYINAPTGVSEKVLYSTEVPKDSNNYVKDYRLRMWIPSTINFSPDENDNYKYNNKTFTVTVNVYANAEVVTVPEEPDTPTGPIAYYAFGTPTTASTTNFLDVITESGSITFLKLEEEQLSVCIYLNEKLECFKNNNFVEESTHLVNVFGEDNCYVIDDFVDCLNSNKDIECQVSSGGNVYCDNRTVRHTCGLSFSGAAKCE